MKIFISSLINGMEPIRAAAKEAIEQLGHQSVMAEQFIASPNSPQVACLQGLRQSGLVILILGEHYGATQPSGLSATHEEYREARDRCPVIAFVQEGIDRDEQEKQFMTEVQAWASGLFRGGFTKPEQLKAMITRAVHEWEIANAAGPLDANEMLTRALGLLPKSERDRGFQEGRQLVVSIAAGPAQTIIRPADIERQEFGDQLAQLALFGKAKIFDMGKPTTNHIEDHALVLTQSKGSEFVIDPMGGMRFTLAMDRQGHGPIVIEENVQQHLASALAFGAAVLDQVDPTQRLTHIVIAATLNAGDSVVWRTQREQDASPTSYSMGFGQPERKPVHLSPPQRPRAVLHHDATQLVEDFTTLLRRAWKPNR
ncbi:DUF4062 domain-containing protein [Agrobacterium rosae]|uniref:DUF4062 domain-containing protein n=1 Tax=Agrobacterium rosae TaxID=1972867 RepID=UPI003A80BE73